MFTNTEECLVQRSQSLLTIKNKKRMFVAVQSRCAFKLSAGKKPHRVSHTEYAAGRIIAGNRDYEILCLLRIPDEITLKVWKHSHSRMDLAEQFFQRAWIGVFKETHIRPLLLHRQRFICFT